jgi:KDO2-lipid IV(A) lauroyltransferase
VAWLLQFLVGCLPRAALWSLARPLGACLHASRGVRRLIHANLAAALPEQPASERDRIGRATCRHLVQTLLELLWFRAHPQRLVQAVTLPPETAAQLAALRAGRPPLVLCPHIGNWELAGQFVSALGIPFAAVASPLRSMAVERLLTQARRTHGMELIPEHGAARGIVRAVRAGRCIGLLMDQNTPPRRGGLFVTFFGLPAATSRAPAALARRLGLDIIPGMLVRIGGRLELRIARLPQPVAAYASDEELTVALMQVNEELIRRNPEQYLWLYRRWRYIPDDATPEQRARLPYYARPVDPPRRPGGRGAGDAP